MQPIVYLISNAVHMYAVYILFTGFWVRASCLNMRSS